MGASLVSQKKKKKNTQRLMQLHNLHVLKTLFEPMTKANIQLQYS